MRVECHPRRGGDGPRGRGRRRALAVAALLLAAALVWFLVSLFQPLKGDGHGQVTVTIPNRRTGVVIALSGAGDLKMPAIAAELARATATAVNRLKMRS